MPVEVKGVIVSRLVVLISIILVPIAIFTIYNLVEFELWFPASPTAKFWIIKVICPLVFSISWLFFLILFATRLSNTIESKNKTLTVIPLRLKIFYGINAFFILFIFIFPLITPIVSILSFASMGWRLTTFKRKDWEDSDTSSLTTIMMILFSLPPVICSIIILPGYFILALFLWNNLWVPLLDLILTISYCLFTALAIGSMIILIRNSGISEYEQIFDDPDNKKNLIGVAIFTIFLFFGFLFLALGGFEVILMFYWIGIVIMVFVSLINYVSGRKRITNFKAHLFGYFLATIFMFSSVLYDLEISVIFKMISLLASAILFIIIFFYNFLTYEETSM